MKRSAVELYHVTPAHNIPWIFKEGLYPQSGPRVSGADPKGCYVYAYTNREAALAACAEGGELRKLISLSLEEGEEIYVFGIRILPQASAALAHPKDPNTVGLMCAIPASNLVLLDSKLQPVSEEKLAELKRRYGVEPSPTYRTPLKQLSF